jgi:CRISPR-associated protein Csb3
MSDIRIHVDPTNPGQFFACCGLLELAHKIYPEATAAFVHESGAFSFDLRLPNSHDPHSLIIDLIKCDVISTLTEEQLERLRKFLNKNKKTFTELEAIEKQKLKALWDRERLRIGQPYNFWIDWWNDEFAGGSNFKTWAGKQFAIDILRGVQQGLRACYKEAEIKSLMNLSVSDGALPFYFNSDIGGHSASLDVGYSLDALEIRADTKPAIEFLSFIGLQRFRPNRSRDRKTFAYHLWTEHLPPMLAAATACGALVSEHLYCFEFRLLFRTKYLKAFLPAKPQPIQP